MSVQSENSFIFLGGGNMARAMINGALKAGFIAKEKVVISVRSEESAVKWKSEGFTVYTDNTEMINAHREAIVVICVKPQLFPTVVSKLPPNCLSDCPLLVSIMAGLTTSTLSSAIINLGYKEPVVRLMPSVPCQIGQSASLITFSCSEQEVGVFQLDTVTRLASTAGSYTILDERLFDAASAVSSCGPAFVYILIEALADGGVYAGLPRQKALSLATQTFLGAAKMVQETGKHPGLLKDEVCSGGGTTIAGVRELERAGVRSGLIEAVRAASERAKTLSNN